MINRNRNPIVARIRTNLLYAVVYVNHYYGFETELNITDVATEPLPEISQRIKNSYINAKELYKIYG